MADAVPGAGPDLRANPDSPTTVQDARDDAPTSRDTRDDVSMARDTRDDAPIGRDATDASPTDRSADTLASPEAGESRDLARPDGQGADTPTEILSRQTVRLNVQSARAAVAITAAFLCAPFTIERQNPDGRWRNLVLGIPFQCGCECPVAGSAHPTELASFMVQPTVTWDARELVVTSESRACASDPAANVLVSAAQPVGAGHYRATVAVLDKAPAECTKAATGRATCQYPYGVGATPTDYTLCAHDLTAQAEFDLPASGDIEVNLLVGGP